MPTYPYQLLNLEMTLCVPQHLETTSLMCVYQWYVQRWIAQVYLSLSDDMYVDACMVSEGV